MLVEENLEHCLSDSFTRSAMDSRICVLDATEDLLVFIDKIHLSLSEEVNQDGKLKLGRSQEAWIKYFEEETASIYHMREERVGTMYLNTQVYDRYEIALSRAKHLSNTLWLYQFSEDDHYEE